MSDDEFKDDLFDYDPDPKDLIDYDDDLEDPEPKLRPVSVCNDCVSNHSKPERSAYKRALEEGKLDIAYGRMILLGTAGVGKTSLKRSLMKLPFDPKTRSTVVSDISYVQPVEYRWHAMELEEKWKEVTSDDELNEMAQLLAMVYHSSSTSRSLLSKVAAMSLYPISAIAHMIEAVSLSEEQIEDIEKDRVESIFLKAMERAIEMPKDDLVKMEPQPLFNIWDCGGQPIFLEILPAFLTPRTMFFLMFNTMKSLNEKWHSVISTEGEQEFDEEVDETTLELLLSWMANIHSQLITYDDGAIPDYPRMYCIGTHGDQLNEQKKTEVKDELESHYRDKVFAPLIEDSLIVDNTTSGKGKFEDPNFAKLRKAICKFASEKVIVETPVSWVLFRKVIQQYRKNVIGLEEAYAIGIACKIPYDDVPKVLLFYHDVGVLLFYPHIDGLQNAVIINPKWFVDVLGRVFTLKEKDTGARTWCWRKLLREKGILVQPFYHDESVWRGCEGLDPNSIMELLIHFCLAAEVFTKEYDQAVKHYFLPAVLKSFLGDPNNVAPGYLKYAAPLHIVFPTTKLTPPGFFTRLATAIAGHPSCELFFKDGIFRNRVTFLYGRSQIDRVTLTDLHYAMQVNVLRYAPDSHSPQSFNAICQELVTVLEDCITKVKETLNTSTRVLDQRNIAVQTTEVRFVCGYGDCGQLRYKSCGIPAKVNHPHYLVTTKGQTSDLTLHCEEKPTNFRKPTAEEGVWFKEMGKGEKPKKIEALTQLVPIASHWHMIGEALEVPFDKLQSIRQNHGADPDTMKLSLMIEEWLKQPNADWATLKKVVEGPLVNNKEVADNICKFVTKSFNM